MKKSIVWVILFLWIAPVMLQAGWWDNKNKEENTAQQVEPKKGAKDANQLEPKQEHKEFKQNLQEMTLAEKQAMIRQRHDAQIAENKAFQQAKHDKQMAELHGKLANNAKLTEAQKNEIRSSREKQYQKNISYGEQRQAENDAFLKKLSSDPNMTEDQKREAIRAHFQSQKLNSGVFRQQQRSENRSEREKIRSLATTNSTTTVAQ